MRLHNYDLREKQGSPLQSVESQNVGEMRGS